MAKQPSNGNGANNNVPSSSPPSTKTDVIIKNDPVLSSFLSNEIIPLPPRTIGGLRDQIPKIKQCNCRRSHCLKLYCECFAAGIFCQNECRCSDCHNVNESISRYEAIRTTLNRNVNAFRPRMTIVESFSPKDAISEEGLYTRLKDTPSSMDHDFLPIPSGKKSISSTSVSKSESNKNLPFKSLKPYPQYSNVVQSQPTFARGNFKSCKLGCNCRKSNCLKKYYECFQESIYCIPSCHCTDCKNRVGNAEREALINNNRKLEERECIALTSAYAIGNIEGNSGVSSGVSGVAVGGVVAATTNPALSGNDGGGRAEVLAKGVAAEGIDVFLPPFSYAVPSFGKIRDLSSNGTFGQQVVGGALDNFLDRFSGDEKLEKQREGQKSKLPTKREKTQEKVEICETDLERRWRIATEYLEEKNELMLDVLSKHGDKIMKGITDEQCTRKQARSSNSSNKSSEVADERDSPIASSFNIERNLQSKVKLELAIPAGNEQIWSLSPTTSCSLNDRLVSKRKISALMKDMHQLENVLLRVEADAKIKFENIVSEKIEDVPSDEMIPGRASTQQLQLPINIDVGANLDGDDKTQVLINNTNESITLNKRNETGFEGKHQCNLIEQVQGEGGSHDHCADSIITESCDSDQLLHKKQVLKMKDMSNHEARSWRNTQNVRKTVIIHNLLNNSHKRHNKNGDIKSKEISNVANGDCLSYENQEENDLLYRANKVFIEENNNWETNGNTCKSRSESKNNIEGTHDKIDNLPQKRQENPEEMLQDKNTRDPCNLLRCDEQVPLGADCSPATKDISMEAVKELYILANQDSSLLHELAKMIRKRALSLAAKRAERKKMKL